MDRQTSFGCERRAGISRKKAHKKPHRAPALCGFFMALSRDSVAARAALLASFFFIRTTPFRRLFFSLLSEDFF